VPSREMASQGPKLSSGLGLRCREDVVAGTRDDPALLREVRERGLAGGGDLFCEGRNED
jgi:hypothetical protein